MPKQTFLNLNAQKQRNIVYAALTEFTEQGYTLGSVGTIAKKASVAKGSMYQYFEDKKEFYLYLMDYAYSMVKTALKMQLEETIQKFESIELLLEQWNVLFWNIINSYQAEVCFSIATLREQDIDIRNRVDQWKNEYRITLIEPQIKKLMEFDQVRTDIDTEFCSLYCQSVSMICKEQIINSVIIDETSNQLVIRMSKEDWNVTFYRIAELLLRGFHKV